MAAAPPSSPDAVDIVRIGGAEPRFADAAAVRRAVFIVEQRIDEAEEWDATDAVAVHLLAVKGGVPVGTLRYFEEDGWMHIGRVAVLEAHRAGGIGRRLMERCLADLARTGKAERVCLNAQSARMGFYATLGFAPVGEEFMEAGIPHRRMEWTRRGG